MELTDTEREHIAQKNADRLIEMLVEEMVESGEPRSVFYDHANEIVDAAFIAQKIMGAAFMRNYIFNIQLILESIARHHAEYLLSQMDTEEVGIFLHDDEERKALIRGKQ